jgi:hypothetical protein
MALELVVPWSRDKIYFFIGRDFKVKASERAVSPFGGGRGRIALVHPLPPPAGDIVSGCRTARLFDCKTA